MAERLPRPSTDQEEAPLLRDPEAETGEQNGTARPKSFKDKLTSLAEEPLTPLSTLLLVLLVIFLLLSSVFIGLFAGVQHKLDSERKDHHELPGDLPGNAPGTTIISTETATATSTAVSTATATSTVTTTTTTTSTQPTPTGPPPVPLCLSQHCILTAASFISSLDTTQDPCENFYDYANGNWLKTHPVPGDKASFGTFEKLAQENGLLVRQILESDSFVPDSTSDKKLLKKIRNFYDSCLDEERLNKAGDEPLAEVALAIRRLFRGESTKIKSRSMNSARGLTAAIAYMHSRGIPGLFSTVIEGDGLRPNDMSLWFYQADLGLPSKEYYEEEAVVKIYQDVLKKLLLALEEAEEDLLTKGSKLTLTSQSSNVWPPWPWPPWGGDSDKDKPKPVNKSEEARRLAKQVVEFEKDIAKASLDLDIMQQDPFATYNPVPLKNLTEPLRNYVNFGEYFATFATRSFPTTVIVTHPPYVEALAKLLDSTSMDTIEAYLVTRAALELAPYLGQSSKAWKAQRLLQEELFGLKKGVVGDRAEWCAARVEGALGFASGRFFVQETFGGDSREKATKVITDIVAAFKNSLPHLTWMDKESAEAAAEKADAIRVKVGFPLSPDTRNPDSLLSYYSRVNVGEGFFDNILSARQNDEFKKWLQLGKQRNMQAWEMFPSTVNAYYNPPSSEIVFPAGILQPPFFSKDWPHYMSYGAFGQVAAHELTHAFDSAGRLYDPEGRLSEWWTNSTSKAFDVKQECIVNQYAKYTVDDGKGGKVYVNGNLTSGENIGDSGIIQAFRAWKAQYDLSLEDGTEYLLPGLNYTREQLFFLSFGQIWARNMKPAAAVQRVRTDPHAPSRYRVEGTLSNVPEFAEAFKCKKGSKLNPPNKERCMFWG